MSILKKIFLPEIERNDFSFDRYIRDLNKNKFRDRFNLGVCELDGGTWLRKDFTKEPNALYVGAMGSGKSVACRFTLLTWMLANSDQTLLFIIDTVKGAQDYKMFFGLDQVYEIIGSPEGVHRVIDLVYDEAMARKELFNEIGANGITAYEAKTGKSMARCILLMEEFHALPFAVMNFDKDHKHEGTTANKYHTLMRIGRSVGIWFLACSQKSTSSDVPKEVVPNFTQKQIFKVSKGESNYVLGHDGPANLRSDQQGRCYTDFGEVQFPYIDDAMAEKLLDKYVKPCSADCARLTPSMIEDVLAGRSTKEQYKHKPLKELAKRFTSLNSEVVVTLLHESMGHQVEEINSALDPNNISHIVTWPNGEKSAVMVKNVKRLSNKHITKLIQGIERLGCDNGILYTSADSASQSLYKFANENEIELVDHEDFILLAGQVDNALKENKMRDFRQDSLASDEKESGEYHKRIEEQTSESVSGAVDESESDTNMIEEKMRIKQEARKEDSYLEELDESDFSNDFVDQDDINEIIDANIPLLLGEKIKAPSTIIDDVFEELEKDKREAEQKEETSGSNLQDIFGTNKEVLNTKKLKRPTVPISFKLYPEDNPSVMINCLRNDNNEVYRVLFYTILNNKLKHKYFIDKQIESSFSYLNKRKLGIKDTKDWNSDPLVNNNREFQTNFDRYLENFNECENNIRFVIWKKDIDFFEEYIKDKKDNISNIPTILDNYFNDIFGVMDESDYLSREMLIKELNLKVDKVTIFDDIELDFQLWIHTL